MRRFNIVKYLSLLSFIALASCDGRCRNFIIKKAHLRPVKIIGTDLNEDDTSLYVILNFDLEYTNCSITGGGVEAGLDGISDPITNLEILDSGKVNINSKFIGVEFEGDLIKEVSDSMSGASFFSNDNLRELVGNINSHKRNETGTRLEFFRPFTVPGNTKWPLIFKMYFSNSDSLVQKFDYNENDIKTYVIYDANRMPTILRKGETPSIIIEKHPDKTILDSLELLSPNKNDSVQITCARGKRNRIYGLELADMLKKNGYNRVSIQLGGNSWYESKINIFRLNQSNIWMYISL
jgi:hypothetical protein